MLRLRHGGAFPVAQVVGGELVAKDRKGEPDQAHAEDGEQDPLQLGEAHGLLSTRLQVKVGGDEAHPVYAFLTSRPVPVGGPVRWNFEKYLVDRRGNVVARYPPRVSPSDAALVREIERLLRSER